MRFDLTELRNLPMARDATKVRWIGFAMFAIIGGAVLDSVAVKLTAAQGFTAPQTVVFLGSALISAMGFLVFLGLGPSPRAVTIDSHGITFEFSMGRKELMDWTGPRFALRIESTDGVIIRGVRGPPMIIARGHIPFRRYLTRDAYHEMVRQARANGLTVVERGPDETRFSLTTISRS